MLARYDSIADVDFRDYVSESQDLIYKARDFLDADRARFHGRIFEFIHRRKWTVEWSRGRLLVYQFDQCVQPRDVTQRAADAITFANLIRETVEQTEQYLERKMHSAIVRIQGS